MGKLIPNKSRWQRPQVRLRDGVLRAWIDENTTLGALAKKIGCARWTLCRYINGTRDPDKLAQRKLMEATGLPFWTLFEETPTNLG